MSTLLYESLTAARQSTASGNSLVFAEAVAADGAQKKEDVNKFVDSVAALVPAEALALHALIFTAVTDSDETEADVLTVTIVDRGWAQAGWVVCLLLVLGLYLGPHLAKGKFGLGDVVRMFIPAGAFVAWTFVLETSLFDAISDWSDGRRAVVGGAIGALALILSRIFAQAAENESN
jgi:hypothetical protein